jgi:hypothetical protein
VNVGSPYSEGNFVAHRTPLYTSSSVLPDLAGSLYIVHSVVKLKSEYRLALLRKELCCTSHTPAHFPLVALLRLAFIAAGAVFILPAL